MTGASPGLLQRLAPLAMIAGFGAVGVSAFILLAAGPRLLGADGYSSLAITWTAVTIIGNGIAQPGEQTITRAMAAGQGFSVVVSVGRRLALLPIAATLLLPLSTGALGAQIGDYWWWAASFTLAALSWAVLACVRGMLAGHQQFTFYAATLVVESLTRIGLVLMALLVPIQGLPLLAGAVSIPLAASAAVGWWYTRRNIDPSVEVVAEDSRAEQLSITTVALMMQVCLSTAPLWLHWQSADEAIAGAFVSALTYIRIPMLLAGGLYGPILAGAAKAYSIGDRVGVLSGAVRGLVAGAGGSALVVGALLAVSGPALTIFYGGDTGLPTAVLVWLGVATVGSVAATVLTQLLYGCERSPSAAAAWLIPAAVSSLLYATAAGQVARMSVSMALGQVLAVLLLAALVPRSLPSSRPLHRAEV